MIKILKPGEQVYEEVNKEVHAVRSKPKVKNKLLLFIELGPPLCSTTFLNPLYIEPF